MRFGKAARLTERREYLAVQGRGMKLHAGPYLVFVLASGHGRARLGVTVSSKVGNAVERNRVKRWLREAFQEVAAALPPRDVVVVARPPAKVAGLAGARCALAAAAAPTANRPQRGGEPR